MMTPARGELVVVPDADGLAHAGAKIFVDLAAGLPGRFVVGLAGGSTPRPLYELLAQSPWREAVDWSKTIAVLGDERFVAPDDPDSNLHMIRTALLDHVGIGAEQIASVPYAGLDVTRAAVLYEKRLQEIYGATSLAAERKFFDLNFLGMGDDGHTASLLPGQEELLAERRRWALPVTKGRPEARVTLTYPVLESATVTVFLVSGAGKREMLDRILSGAERNVPAARLVPQGRLIWLVDRAAAGRWADLAP